MEKYKKELKIGSADDMLAHATDNKVLTLKGLEKDVNLKFAEMEKHIKFLETRINIINKALKR